MENPIICEVHGICSPFCKKECNTNIVATNSILKKPKVCKIVGADLGDNTLTIEFPPGTSVRGTIIGKQVTLMV